MSVARSSFLRRCEIIVDSLSAPASIDGPAIEVARNSRAAVFRRGISISIFAALESFLKDRTHEIITAFPVHGIAFAQLDGKMQRALTLGAIQGLAFQCKLVGDDPSLQASKFMAEIAQIQSTAGNLARASRYAFCHQASNVSASDVLSILDAFGVANGWHCIDALSKRYGMGGFLDYRNQYDQIAELRHSSAHNPSSNIPSGDLSSAIELVIAIALGVDVLASAALYSRSIGISLPAINFDKNVHFRFLRPSRADPAKFEEVEEAKSPGRRLSIINLHGSLSDARISGQANATSNKESLITLSISGKPIDWTTFPA